MDWIEIKRMLISLHLLGGEPELEIQLNGKTYMIILYDDCCTFQICGEDCRETKYIDLDALYSAIIIDGVRLSKCWGKIKSFTLNGCDIKEYESILKSYSTSPVCKDRLARRHEEPGIKKRHILTDIFPEIVEQIRADINYGFSVLNIPKEDIEIRIYDHDTFFKPSIYGEVDPDINRFSFYLGDKVIITEAEKAELSFAVFATLRWWFRKQTVAGYIKSGTKPPFVTDEDINGWRSFIGPVAWFATKNPQSNSYGKQFAFIDMYAFALMLTQKKHPKYEEKCDSKNELILERKIKLLERYGERI